MNPETLNPTEGLCRDHQKKSKQGQIAIQVELA